MFAVRECFEQLGRGDHFIFGHPSNASSWNESCIRKPIAQTSVLSIERPICRWSVESGFVRELTSWLTHDPDLADALEKWRETVSGVEPNRHVQV